MVAGAFPCLHCRRIGREFAELIGRVGAHRRRARIARTEMALTNFIIASPFGMSKVSTTSYCPVVT
jgi:hypothetical protein